MFVLVGLMCKPRMVVIALIMYARLVWATGLFVRFYRFFCLSLLVWDFVIKLLGCCRCLGFCCLGFLCFVF